MITHEELKEYINPWVHSELLSNCPYCGHPIETTNNLRSRMCSNKNCSWKQAHKAAKMLEELNIPDAKEKTCYKWIQLNHLEHHFELFDPNRFRLGSDHKAYSKIITKRSLPLYKVIEYLGIDQLGPERAISEFGRYGSVQDLLKSNWRRFLTAEDMKILLYAQRVFNIESVKDIPIVYVMLTRSIKGFSNRKHFISALNDRFNGVIHFKEVGMVSYANVLVSDNPSASNKVDYARSKGIPLLTSEEFLSNIMNFLRKNGELSHIK